MSQEVKSDVASRGQSLRQDEEEDEEEKQEPLDEAYQVYVEIRAS
jgi:hypothetical protein